MNSLFITKPFLPPLDEFIPYLENIWESRTITNGGPYHEELERALCEYLGIKYISLFTNGTIALISALKALNISGEVITTPYTFVATSHSLLWNGLVPVFVDVDPNTFNIDPSKIESAITSKTSAILAVHCYGNPCDVEAIEAIAKKHNLRVIYDAAHAFGVECHCGSILNHGDLSVLSFHATKVFNTFEGGAIISNDSQTKKIIDQLKNFGHNGEILVENVGINGKMSEFNAALGLLQLKHMPEVMKRREAIYFRYVEGIGKIPGIKIMDISKVKRWNYSYFPVLVLEEFPLKRDELYENLKNEGIYSRRYFYPPVSNFSMYKNAVSSHQKNLIFANNISNKVLCLPIYPGLDNSDIDKVIAIIKAA